MSTDSEKRDPFEQSVMAAIPPGMWNDLRLCIAVSGGADSVSLLHAIIRTASRLASTDRIVVGHIDHQARGDESRQDACFVQSLAEKLGVNCQIRRIDPDILRQENAKTGSWEAAARNIRYELLTDIAQTQGARYVALAHTADDRTETALHRIFRGTGIAGLKAIPRTRPINDALVLIRPLLALRRSDVENYLMRIGSPWRNDSSNASFDYTRNRIRAQLIPILEDIFPNQWRSALERLIESADEIDLFLAGEVERLERKIIVMSETTSEITMERAAFLNESQLIVREYFRKLWREKNWHLAQMGRRQWQRLDELVAKGTGTEEFPGAIRVTCEHDQITLCHNQGQ